MSPLSGAKRRLVCSSGRLFSCRLGASEKRLGSSPMGSCALSSCPGGNGGIWPSGMAAKPAAGKSPPLRPWPWLPLQGSALARGHGAVVRGVRGMRGARLGVFGVDLGGMVLFGVRGNRSPVLAAHGIAQQALGYQSAGARLLSTWFCVSAGRAERKSSPVASSTSSTERIQGESERLGMALLGMMKAMASWVLGS